jgi:hypothetical protein
MPAGYASLPDNFSNQGGAEQVSELSVERGPASSLSSLAGPKTDPLRGLWKSGQLQSRAKPIECCIQWRSDVRCGSRRKSIVEIPD